MLPEPHKRIRWLTQDEASRLIAELPEHLADMVLFSLATGLREANVTGLEWSQVDLVRRVAWIHPDQAKAKRAIGVPLNADAVLVLRRWIGRHQERVFCFQARGRDQWRPIGKAGTAAWKKALERAGIKSFRWHDLRHTWASWHVQLGTPLHVLQEMGGWRLRYPLAIYILNKDLNNGCGATMNRHRGSWSLGSDETTQETPDACHHDSTPMPGSVTSTHLLP
ncbi:site-specific integrase, partial [Thiocystis violacea]|uniref:site-specific integrase n=1 Tax=Thiocystis violacea TaxID=13725 RepID=UPI0030B8B5A0